MKKHRANQLQTIRPWLLFHLARRAAMQSFQTVLSFSVTNGMKVLGNDAVGGRGSVRIGARWGSGWNGRVPRRYQATAELMYRLDRWNIIKYVQE